MKTIKQLIFVILLIIFSCNSGEKSTGDSIVFGIYETVNLNEIPLSVLNEIKNSVVEFGYDSVQPIIGQVSKSDSTSSQYDFHKEAIRLLKTKYSLGGDKELVSLIALRLNPTISNWDIRKTKSRGRNIEIHFTMSGAKKWADMVKKNEGRNIAFVLNDQVYSISHINGKINNGAALLSGFDDEITAGKISDLLNNES